MKTSLPSSSGTKRHNRLAVWLVFPRRLVFLLAALGGLVLLLGLALDSMSNSGFARVRDWTTSIAFKKPILALIQEHLPASLVLLGVGLLLAFLLALIYTGLSALISRIGGKGGWPGVLLKGAGRLAAGVIIALPAFALAILAVWIFYVKLKWLPSIGMTTPNDGSGMDRFRHLVLPAFSLALVPAFLAGHSIIPASLKRGQDWWIAMLKILAALFRQSSGLLTMLVLVEIVFGWPGVGNLFSRSMQGGDAPLALGCMAVLAGMVFTGQLLADLVAGPTAFLASMRVEEPRQPVRKDTRRLVWLCLTLALVVLVPLILTVFGATVDTRVVSRTSTAGRQAPPSLDHPLGTDPLGRDVLARLRYGSAISFGTALIAAVLATCLAFPGGLLAGWLIRKRKWWADLLADIVLFPADLLLLMPVVALAFLVRLVSILNANISWILLGLATGILILPRMLHLASRMWAADVDGKIIKKIGLSLGAVFAGSLFSGFAISNIINFLGIGLRPPLVSLGGEMATNYSQLLTGTNWIFPVILLWIYLYLFYLAFDAMLGYFSGHEAALWLNG
jgi:peptide/nickel transport system permease protein